MTTTAELRNWAGNVSFGAEHLRRPQTVEQLQEVVGASSRIRALGSGHSFNRIADTTGDLVTVADLDATIEIDSATSTVLVGAGVRYGELGGALEHQGLALANLGSLPHITVGGATSTGTHGSGIGNRCLADQVVGIEMVRADGELVSVAAGDPAFGGSVLALGALGVTTRLRLSVKPSFQIRQDVWLDADLDAVLDDIDAVLGAGYSVSLFTEWHDRDRLDQIWIKGLADAPLVDGTRWGARPAAEAHHPIAGADASTATQQLGVPGPWIARLPHFRLEFTPSSGEEQQSEFFVAREHAAAAIAALRELELHPALMVCEVRTIAADDLWISPFHQRDTVALHFTWVDDDELVRPVVRQVEAALAGFDVRPHWGKVFEMAPDVVRAHYPRMDEFRALAAAHDPQRKFGNDFLESFVYD
ncbi:FAD-binding protein [uncultured Jatrophihabitans sp.]|uniref:FAD-binding protein n=1 Tax=uncultured Jatrophihabitans sp. TaxID=1610747 RepID=UPI0035CC19B2